MSPNDKFKLSTPFKNGRSSIYEDIAYGNNRTFGRSGPTEIGPFLANNEQHYYAGFGNSIGYWHTFPTPIEGFGLIPVWGFAGVTESRAVGVEVGARVWVFFRWGTKLSSMPGTSPSFHLLIPNPNGAKSLPSMRGITFAQTIRFTRRKPKPSRHSFVRYSSHLSRPRSF